ncbi:MAG TPA: nuclear transport factor 2 family protein [Hanamia sp.]|nr:nuclear transport factor 2 family protein [Hanamia sp.]
MNLSRIELQQHFDKWLIAWNNHDIRGVMEFMHNDIVFDNWNGRKISGKSNLEKTWKAWFMRHGNFKFILEDVFIDELNQKMGFTWQLEWPSLEKKYAGKPEKRRGVDILYLKEGKIFKKNTYSKTTIEIDSLQVTMYAE